MWKIYDIKSIRVLNTTITFKEFVGIKNGNAYKEFFIGFNAGRYSFGNAGTASNFART